MTGVLVGALLRRELRPGRLAGAGLLVAGATAALGRHLAARGLVPGANGATGPAGVGPFGATARSMPFAPADVALALLANALVPAFAIVAAYLVIDRVAGDHEAGWLPALAATGGRRLRAAYAITVPTAVLAAVVPLLGLALVALAVGAGVGMAAALRSTIDALPGAGAFALATTSYAGAVAVLLRRRRVALAAATVGTVAPVAIVAWWQASASHAPPTALVRLLAAHMPLLAWHGDAWLLARHVGYAAVVLMLVAAAAPHLVARDR